MKISFIFAVSIAALTLSGCGKKVDTAPTENLAQADHNVAQVPAAKSPAQSFADTAASSDSFEIESAKLAATKASSAKVKRFAEEMIRAHSASTDRLKAVAGALTPPITPIALLTPEQLQTINSLSSLSGQAFDTAYGAAQVKAHETALAGLKDYAANGNVAPFKDFAAKLVPTVTAHLNMARGL